MANKKYNLDAEELEIEQAFEKAEPKMVENFQEEKKRFQKLAKAHGNKVKRVNLRMTSWDYEKAQEKALIEGLPYQTFLSSVLHKYLTGRLIDRNPS